MGDRNLYSVATGVGRGEARMIKEFGGTFSLVAADLTLNRTTGLFIAPAGLIVVPTGFRCQVTDLDTGGSPALMLTLGDSGDDDRFMAASNIGQAGGTNSTMAAAGIFYEFTQDTEVFLKATTAAATGAAGTLTLNFCGYMK